MAVDRLALRSLFYGDVQTAGARSGNKIRFSPGIPEDLYADLKTGGSNGIGAT
jgi:hypothetical protein